MSRKLKPFSVSFSVFGAAGHLRLNKYSIVNPNTAHIITTHFRWHCAKPKVFLCGTSRVGGTLIFSALIRRWIKVIAIQESTKRWSIKRRTWLWRLGHSILMYWANLRNTLRNCLGMWRLTVNISVYVDKISRCDIHDVKFLSTKLSVTVVSMYLLLLIADKCEHV